MEGGQRKLDVTKVAIALLRGLPASGTKGVLGGSAHARVHGAIGGVDALIAGVGGSEIVDVSVRDLKGGLADDIVVGA